MKKKVFAQLYSIVRQEREGHLEALRNLSEIGYDGVELLGYNTNGLSVSEYKNYLSELNLQAISSHNLHDEKDYEFAQAIGLKYSVIPGCDAERNPEKLKTICEEWNETGRILQKYGMKGVIHNHGEEFCWMEEEKKEERIYDFLMEHTDPALIGFELDVGWVERAGVCSLDVLRKYKGRFPLIHIKECAYPAGNFDELEHFPHRILELGEPEIINGVPYFSEEQKSLFYDSRKWNVELGKGIVDFQAICEEAEAQGCEAYVNEREYYHLEHVPDGDPVSCAKLDYEYLRSL